MKIQSVLITSVFALASLNALASGGTSEFTEIFEPYVGTTFSVQCGETLSRAKSAEKQEAVLELFDEARSIAVSLRTQNHFIYFRSLETSSTRYYEPYGGDIGGKTIHISNELDGDVFTQTRTEKGGLIFKSKSFEMISTLDFSSSKEWIYSATRDHFSGDPISEEVCLLLIKQ